MSLSSISGVNTTPTRLQYGNTRGGLISSVVGINQPLQSNTSIIIGSVKTLSDPKEENPVVTVAKVPVKVIGSVLTVPMDLLNSLDIGWNFSNTKKLWNW